MSDMHRLSIRIVEELVDGQRRSLRAGGNKSRALVVNLLSDCGVVGCLTLQYAESGQPKIKLRREQGFECEIQSFAQTKLFQFSVTSREGST